MSDDSNLEPQSLPDPTSYSEAVKELEAILLDIEGDNVDVDVLTAQVARAAQLVRWCRNRIGVARNDLEQIVAGIEIDSDTP